MLNNENLLSIIKEEIMNFDFLGNDKHSISQEYIDALRNPKIQGEFISDSLLNKNNIKTKLSDNKINYYNILNVYVVYDIEYKIDGLENPLKFSLTFEGENISHNVKTNHEIEGQYTPEYNDSMIENFEWEDIDVSLYSDEFGDIDFIALDKAPNNITNLFIKHYTKDIIEQSIDVQIS